MKTTCYSQRPCTSLVFVKAGVPQGFVIGPLIFLVYINDILNEIIASVRLFTDDTSFYIIVDNPNSAAVTLISDLRHITYWEDKIDVNASFFFFPHLQKNIKLSITRLYISAIC